MPRKFQRKTKSPSSNGGKNSSARRIRSGTADEIQKLETVWASIAGRPPLLRMPALRTFITLMSQNPGELTQAAAFVAGQYSYFMSNFNGSADYLALFDSYRIRQVECVIRPAYNVGTANLNPPTIYSVVDYDDGALPTASQMREYANCELTQYETVCRHFVPAVNVPSYVGGGAATGSNSVFAPWIDAASVNVEHFGVKIGMDGSATANTQQLEINHRFIVEWRCTR